ncbi:large conductance mechanosensitive channel protein MscL [Allofustis seminis]|uniref:large conductance mechanosensitive channel protein MscL n=1 Tax=Allofustis seminis TaxID=166939 RepID=UPI00036CBA52|nr:large conductance mechanosensitive channel protein MscL [Allofustis seminis]
MIKEFKAFIMRGNILDLAVGVVMGTAFTAVVNGLVEGIIMPLIAAIAGNASVADMAITLNGTAIPYGIFLQALVDFLLISLVLFFILKAVNKVRTLHHHEEAEEKPAAPTSEDYLREIRDLLQQEKTSAQ